jgi:uncharacterized protein YqgV (UPF0045/DUF77 family)
MRIVAELSMYPLIEDPIPPIVEFILELREQEGLEVVSNQMSTQIRGEFDAVTGAVQRCMRRAMEQADKMVMVVKYLKADLEIGRTPSID